MPLRASQQQILAYDGGPMGVSAVPGSGKTFTIAQLAARLIAEGRAGRGQVLVVTYQNAAVDNVKARIARFLDERGLVQTGYDVRTLHSLAYSIVQRYPGPAGTGAELNVLDAQVQGRLLERAVERWNRQHEDVWRALRPEGATKTGWFETWERLSVALTRTIISTAKNHRLSAGDLRARLAARDPEGLAASPQGILTGGVSPFLRVGADGYALYQQLLRTDGALDYDDLVWRAVDLLERSPGVAERLRRQYPFVLEDEAQDSVPLQSVLLSLIAGEGGNLVRVGDPNQAISSTFTAADPKHFNAFLKNLPASRRHLLDEAGRSSPRIIRLANELVRLVSEEHPVEQVRRRAFRPQAIRPTAPDDPQQNPPDPPRGLDFRVYESRDRELEQVARRAARFAQQNPEATCGVLVPANWMGYEIAEHLRAAGAPVDELLRTTVTARDVTTTLARVLRFLADPLRSGHLRDAYLALQHVNPGLRSDDPDNTAVLLASCYRPEQLLFPQENQQRTGALLGTARFGASDYTAATRLADLLARWMRAAHLPIDQLVMTISQDVFDPGKLATAQQVARELRSRADRQPALRLPDFAREAETLTESGAFTLHEDTLGFEPRPGIITLTTMFKAKGLEWDLVYLAGVDDREFPYTLDDYFKGERSIPGTNARAEAKAALLEVAGQADAPTEPATEAARINAISERLRLLYVGITRARRYFAVSAHRTPGGHNAAARPLRLLGFFAREQLGMQTRSAS